MTYTKEADQKAVTKKLVRMLADEADVIPLYNVPAAYLTQPYVHCNYYKEGLIRWRTFDDWMDKALGDAVPRPFPKRRGRGTFSLPV